MPDKGSIKPQAGREGTTVLVVDDDDYFRKILGAQLHQLGFQSIRTATDGADGLFQFSRSPTPDIVICDLQMPTMNGVDFLRELQFERFSGAILLVSGEHQRTLNTTGDLVSAYGLNLLGVLHKPIDLDALNRALNAPVTPAHLSPAKAQRNDLKINQKQLRDALREGQIQLHYAPQVDLKSGAISGFEALARWPGASPQGSRCADFIDQIPALGLTSEFSRYVINDAIKHFALLRSDTRDWTLAINVFAENLCSPDLQYWIVDLANVSGFPLNRLVLEVVGEPASKDPTKLLEACSQLSVHGVGLALDGCGVGYAAMERLMRLPFTELKLDRDFVHGAHARPGARTILESTIDLAHRFDLRITAEGVADQLDWDLVALNGCDQAQGRFIAPALPAKTLALWATWFERAGTLAGSPARNR